MEEFKAANLKQLTPTNNAEVKWRPQTQGWYKINVDGAVFVAQKEAGVGVIIRDEVGRVVAALSKKIEAPLGALGIEAKAMEEAVIFARDMGISNIILESDSEIIINALSSNGNYPASISNVLQGVELLRRTFRRFAISHTKRKGNKAAHL